MMPAFSPGPCTTRLLRVGSRLRCTREDLYEQCSLHITLKMPSSVQEGSRPSACLIFSYSSGVIPCSSIMAGVIAAAWVVDMVEGLFSHTLRLRLTTAFTTTSALMETPTRAGGTNGCNSLAD